MAADSIVSLYHEDLNYLYNIIAEVRDAVKSPPPHARFNVELYKCGLDRVTWVCKFGDLKGQGKTPEQACADFDDLFYGSRK